MKKTLIAVAALASTAAFAQNVTIDGAVDLGYMKAIGTKDGRLDAGNGASQIRFRGTEDLGGGLKANFTVAQRFSPESGGNDGSANGRPMMQGESTVGISGGFGDIKLGRAVTVFQGPVVATDPWGTLQVASTAVLATGYATDVADTRNGAGAGRTDGIWYTSPNFGGVKLAATVGPKASAASGAASTQSKAFGSYTAQYAAGPLFAWAGLEQNRNGDKAYALLATYDLGMVKIGAGYGKVNNLAAGADTKNWNAMATVPMGAAMIKIGYGTSKNEAGSTTVQKLGLGVDYMLSKRTKIYTAVANDNKAASNKSGFDLGIRHTF